MWSVAWRRFTRWRRGRPFTAGAFTLAAGVAIAVPPYATFRMGDVLVSIRTIGGVSALLIGTLLLACGASLWLRPQFRVVAGVTGLLLSLIALSTSNLGGFLVGTLLGVTGAALALAWTDRPRPPRRARWPRRAAVAVAAVTAVAVTAAWAPATAARAADAPAATSWALLASAVRMDGVVYHGLDTLIVDGRPTRTMRFTARSMSISDPVEVGGEHLVIKAAHADAKSVELHSLRLAGTLELLGLLPIPVDFTPDRPPPLVPPSVLLTNVTTVNARMIGTALTMTDAHLTTP